MVLHSFSTRAFVQEFVSVILPDINGIDRKADQLLRSWPPLGLSEP